MSKPFFTHDRTGNFETFGQHADEAIHIIRSHSQEHSPIDYQDLVFRFAMDAATEFLFGSCVHTLSPGDDGGPDTFASAFGRLQYRLAQRNHLTPWWPLFEMWEDKTEHVSTWDIFHSCWLMFFPTWQDVRIVRDFVRPIIQDAMQRKQSLGGGDLKKDADLDRQTLLDHLVVLTDGEWWFSLKVSFNWYYLRPTNNCRWDGQYATRRTWHSEDRCRARSEGCFFWHHFRMIFRLLRP